MRREPRTLCSLRIKPGMAIIHIGRAYYLRIECVSKGRLSVASEEIATGTGRHICRLKCALTMQRSVRSLKLTVNVPKNHAQHRKMQLIATDPYCSTLLLNLPQRRLRDTETLGPPLEGQQTRRGSGLVPSVFLLVLELSLSGDPQRSSSRRQQQSLKYDNLPP